MEDASINILRVQPGDIVVATFPTFMSEEDSRTSAAALRTALNDAGHHNTPILVLNNGVSFEVLPAADVIEHLLERAEAQ